VSIDPIGDYKIAANWKAKTIVFEVQFLSSKVCDRYKVDHNDRFCDATLSTPQTGARCSNC
jgi:hypothetical protein